MRDPVQVLMHLGGVTSWRTLRRACSWRAIAHALDTGAIVRTAYGHYALPTVDPVRLAASRLTARASHTSAALAHDWPVLHTPVSPHLTVSPRRNLAAARRDGANIHWRTLGEDEVVDGWVTSPVRTVIDCCLDLPFADALAVFDSSWRAGLKPREVQLAALRLPIRQRDKVLAVARAADPRAANPFESALRAIALTVPGLNVEPQYVVSDSNFYARIDLGDPVLKIALEAESFEFHSSPKALERDCRRYNGLGVRDWLVLKATWKLTLFEPHTVRETLAAAVDLRSPPRRGRSTGVKPQNVPKTA